MVFCTYRNHAGIRGIIMTGKIEQTARGEIITVTVHVTGIKSGKSYAVDLYYMPGASTPHGYEATNAETTNQSGYHRTGMLQFEGLELVDYDGTFSLPSVVATALRVSGFTVPEGME